MPRYRLLIEYDGGPFKGWQSQTNGPSVQDALQRAITGFSGKTAIVTAAGRTDTGVHATGQVVHLDLERDWPARTVRDAVNDHLRPDPVSVIEAEVAASDFHARFSATGRRGFMNQVADEEESYFFVCGGMYLIISPASSFAMSLRLGLMNM